MSDYVKKDDILKHLCEYCDSHIVGCGECPIKASIDNVPTVDAVPVSYIYKRAKELKNDDMIYAYTVLNSLIANYRADGKRKDGDLE